MQKYFHALNIGFQNNLTYRFNFLTRTLFGFIPLTAMLFLWESIYAGKPADAATVATYTLSQMISYYLVVAVVDALTVGEIKTKAAADMLRRLGVDGKTLLVDVKPEDKLALSVRNIDGVRLLPSDRISARDVMDTRKVVLTRAALEKLQEALG